jgi:hypothetical protein
MTRQPAEAKRFTVAWPMPREAPVRISVLRSVLGTVVIAISVPIPKFAEPRHQRPERTSES